MQSWNMIIAKSAHWLPLREGGIHRVLLGPGSVLNLDLGRKPSWLLCALQDSSRSQGETYPRGHASLQGRLGSIVPLSVSIAASPGPRRVPVRSGE